MNPILGFVILLLVGYCLLLPFALFRGNSRPPPALVVGAIGFILAFTGMFVTGYGNQSLTFVVAVSGAVGVVGFALGYRLCRVFAVRLSGGDTHRDS